MRTYEKRKMETEVKVLTSATCDNCGAAFKTTRFGDQANDYIINTLIVQFVGYYDGYFDCSDLAEFRPRVELCEGCAYKLLDQWPCMDKAIKENPF